MKALLRFQAVVLARTFSNAVVLAMVVAAGAAALAAPTARDRNLGDLYAVVAFAALASFAVWGMGCTFTALDRLHWSTPASRAGVLRVHFVFWGALCGLPAFAAAIVHEHGEPVAAAKLFLVLMLVTGTAAANVVVFTRWLRSGSFDAAVPAIVLPVATGAPALSMFFLVYYGHFLTSVLVGGAACVVSIAVAARLYRNDEFLPQATETADPRDVFPDRRTTRTPAATARAATHPVVRWMTFIAALGAQFVPESGWFPFPAFFVLIAAPGASAVDLSSCRWLFATPMERGRIFRRLFLPAVLVAVAAASARVCILELRPDRTAFFETVGGRSYIPDRRDVLLVLETEPERMPAQVREHLREAYGLDVPEARIEASIRRGWPQYPSTASSGGVRREQEAVREAMDRVQADLSDEIVGADLRRNLLCGSVVALACIFLLRQKAAHGGGRWKGEGVLHTLFLVALFVPQLWPHSPVTAAIAAAALAVEAPVQHASGFVATLLLLAVPVAGFLLWRSSERAFRRIDITDLPPTTSAGAWTRPAG